VKKSKFTEAQIVTALKKVEAGVTVRELARELKVSAATVFRWKAVVFQNSTGRLRAG
jgi:putative transposase